MARSPRFTFGQSLAEDYLHWTESVNFELGPSGELLGYPLCYRNPLGAFGLQKWSTEDLAFLFEETGIQNLAMNSLNQLKGIEEVLGDLLQGTSNILLIPDLLNYLFTGEMNSEISIASTSQLINMRHREYSSEVFARAKLDQDLFPPLIEHGLPRGTLRQSIAEQYHLPRLQSISIPSHDTAAAVVSVPTAEDHFIFISSGTWSLIGTERKEPIITDHSKERGYSNEGGLGGSITFLKNSCGMHILQNIKREIEFKEKRPYSWDEIIALSNPFLHSPTLPLFDPNDDMLYNPTSMIEAVKKLTALDSIGAIIASSYASLALSYDDAIKDLEKTIDYEFEAINIIGGGSRNAHLNQMVADLTKKTIIAGSEEATSLGIIASLILGDHPNLTVQELRKRFKDTLPLEIFKPA